MAGLREETGVGLYELVSKLGNSLHSTIELVRDRVEKKKFAMKRMDISTESRRLRALLELNVMQRLRSPWAVQLVDSYIKGSEIAIVMEYCAGGDLRKCIGSISDLKLEKRVKVTWEIFAQMVIVLDCMHSQGIWHLDIKPENVFMLKEK